MMWWPQYVVWVLYAADAVAWSVTASNLLGA